MSVVSDLRQYGLLIAGTRQKAASEATIESINPTTGAPWAVIPQAGPADVDSAVEAARTALASSAWQSLSPSRRGRLMMRVGDLVAERAEEIATVETRENGKLYREMLAQLRMVPDWLYYFGGLADKVEGSVIPLDRQSVLNYTLREPLGVVGAITPWNSPVLLTTMTLAPALAAGNTLVLKPSEVASAGVLEFAALFEEAGFPAGVVNVVTGGPTTGEALMRHADVVKVAFTGGSSSGAKIAETVAGRLARYTLELGGKSPNIVFEDADLDAAVAGVLAGIYGAGGQTCVAGSRALIHADIFDEFVDRLAVRAQAIELGDPMSSETQMGPMATEAQLNKVESFVRQAVADGATILVGGKRAVVEKLPAGFFFEPTILGEVPRNSPVAREEIFGPVLAVFPFETDEEALQAANDSRYGLAAGVWTTNLRRAHSMARRLESGTVWVNCYRAVTFNSPFGGYKASGIGRVNGIEAIGEFLQTKSVWVELSDEVQDPFTLRS